MLVKKYFLIPLFMAITTSAIFNQAQAGTLAITNVTIIDTLASDTNTAYRENMTVIIDGERISQIGHSNQIQLPYGIEMIDANGKYLIPGLWDMHVHNTGSRIPKFHWPVLSAFIANGVTNARDLASDCPTPCPRKLQLSNSRKLQKKINKGKVIAPRLQGLASFIVHGPVLDQSQTSPGFFYPGTAEEGRQLAQYQKNRGVDFIKPYDTMPHDAFFAMLDEANQLNLDVAGHVPRAISAIEASDAGLKSIEHARQPIFSCASTSQAFRDRYASYVNGEEAEPSFEETINFRQSFIDQHDPVLCDEVFQTWAANDTYYVPTHVTRRFDALASDPVFQNDPRLNYIPVPLQVFVWQPDLQSTADVSESVRQHFVDFYELGLEITGRAHAAGVKVLAGTDAFDSYIFPGFSLHDELQELVTAGLTPFDALQAATIHPAEFSGVAHEHGVIEEGYIADLVLLNSDPLANIAHTQTIEEVFYNGRRYSRSQLDQFLNETIQNANNPLSYFSYIPLLVCEVLPTLCG